MAPEIAALDDETRAICYRMCADLMGEFGSPLKRREISALAKAARIIAREPRSETRKTLERYTVDRAFSMVADGE
jgi:hypothetical protein